MPKISELTAADRLTGDEEEAITQGGITKRVKKTDFAYQIQSDNLTGGDGEFTSALGEEEPENYTHKICIIGDMTDGYDDARSRAASGIVLGNTRYSLSSDPDSLDFLISAGDVQDADTIDGEIANIFPDSLWDVHTSRLLAAAGDHDYDNSGIAAFQAYSTMSNFTETYFSAVIGDCEFFFIDSNSHADNNITSASLFRASTMGQWVENALADSQATWKIVVCHHPPYSSGTTYGSTAYMQLDWADMGAHVVISGHEHTYERLHLDNVVYLVAGNAGGTVRTFSTPLAESQVRIEGVSAVGATYLWSSRDSLTFEFIKDATTTAVSGDRFRLTRI